MSLSPLTTGMSFMGGGTGRIIGPDEPKDPPETMMLEVLDYLKPTFAVVRDDGNKKPTFRIHFANDIHIMNPSSSGVLATFTFYSDCIDCSFETISGTIKQKNMNAENIVKWFFKASKKEKGGGGEKHPLIKRWIREDSTITAEDLKPQVKGGKKKKEDIVENSSMGKRKIII
jgi:hypothetical protein